MKKSALLVSALFVLLTVFSGCARTAGLPPSLPMIDFTANPANIKAGQSATLQWNVTGAVPVKIEPFPGDVSADGTQTVSPAATTTYVITASNDVGTISKSVQVTVAPPPPPPVVAFFRVDPPTIFAGQTATLKWEAIGADSVTIDQGIGPVTAAGTRTVSPKAAATFTLSASSASGSVTSSQVLNVNEAEPLPVIIFFEVFPELITGGPCMVKWNVTGASSVRIDPGVGKVPSGGQETVYPSGTTTYTLTASNSSGSSQSSGTVVVNRPYAPPCPVP